MPTLYHAPNTRSTGIILQLMMMGKLNDVEVVAVNIPRQDGTGARDPRNPHPEGKVPYLVTDEGHGIRERNAIMLYLDEMFGYPLGVEPRQPGRGLLVSWMSVYGGIVEPIFITTMLGIEHKGIEKSLGTLNGIYDQVSTCLGDSPFLLGDRLTIADMIMASPFQFMPQFTPDIATVKTWIARVSAHTDTFPVEAYEAQAVKAVAAAQVA
jgi:glutathione S-transferase